ncbi:hypothetical protein BVX94_02345 [bacterium B17]|nr:hypothetical protein BVX94_02345 [bacterium B17]
MKKTKKKRKSHFKEGRWGVACKDGKFYQFTDKHVLVMTAWPQPRAWFKRRSHNWRHTRKVADQLFSSRDFVESADAPQKPESPFVLPDGQLALPGISYEEWIAKKEYSEYLTRVEFLSKIPEDIKVELTRYSARRWHMLNLFARCPGTMDLSKSNPALAFALASNWVFHKPAVQRPMRAARALAWKKQKEILAWLGFPATKAVRKIMAKIDPEALNIEMLLYLRDALVNPRCLKMLSHLPHLTRETVMMISNRHLTECVTPNLLEDALANEIQSTNHEDNINAYELLVDTTRMARIVNWEKCPRSFCSLKRLKDVHDELVPKMDLNKLKASCNLPDEFAEPPFTGTDSIIPLTTPEEVCIEGHVQKNCVAAHVPYISRGQEYVYRVEKPVRATLSVVLRQGRWRLDQIYKACNEPVEPYLQAEVFKELCAS